MNQERLRQLTKRYTSMPVRWRFDGKFSDNAAYAEAEHMGDCIEIRVDKRLLTDAYRHHLPDTIFHEIAHVALGHVRPQPAYRRFETIDDMRQASRAAPSLVAAVRAYERNEESAETWAARELAKFEQEHGDFFEWVMEDPLQRISDNLDKILDLIKGRNT